MTAAWTGSTWPGNDAVSGVCGWSVNCRTTTQADSMGTSARTAAAVAISLIPGLLTSPEQRQNARVRPRRKVRPENRKGPGSLRGLLKSAVRTGLRGVVFHDQVRLHLHRERHVGQFRHADEADREAAVAQFDVVRDVAFRRLLGFEHQRHVAGLFLDLDDVADLQTVRRDVDLLAVDGHVAVADELTRGPDGRREFGAIDQGVQTGLQQADQVLRAVALAARSFFVRRGELLLGDVAIVALQLLLGLQLQAEVRDFRLAALAVLAGAVRAFVDGGLGATPQVFTHDPVEFVLGAMALGHMSLSYDAARSLPNWRDDLNGGPRIVRSSSRV